MKLVCRAAFMTAFVVAAIPLAAAAQAPQPSTSQQPTTAQPPSTPQQPTNPPDEQQKYEETVVVSASKTEEKLTNAPATMTVITSPMIQNAPSQNFADLLRTVPGLNVTQVSARDINATSRAATGTLATGTLALLDGRSLYQDMFGFVMWDFLPVNLNEIKQVEVIRGPASAVWGANALYGVVNVITKSPREMPGSSVTFGLGSFGRENEDAGAVWYVNGTHAQAVNDRWAYKVSAGAYSQDPLTRPTGVIPGSPPPGTQYPAYTNSGTLQPKVDGRVDYDYEDGRKLTFSGGVSGTEGIMHTGIGPFDIDSGSVMGYGRVNFTRKGFRAASFFQQLNGNATNLLARDPTGQFIKFAFDTKTVDFDVSNVNTFASRHVVSYGGNLRFNGFDLSIAPQADNRTELGLYAQDEIFLSDHFRWSIGTRMDRFDYLDEFVFSPRTTFMIKPDPNQSIRLSYNRAYRAPSVINNFLDVMLTEPINLGLFSPLLAGQVYLLPIHPYGDQDLTETTLDAYEIGYTGVVGRQVLVSAAFYVNKTKNDIFFTEVPNTRWTASNPPPGWPLPPGAITIATGGAGFPAQFTYLNFGKTTQKGVEFGVDTPVNKYVGLSVNYSYQADPEPEGFDISELNLPPNNRFNIGTTINYNRYFGAFSVGYTGDAFWQDVLDDRYHGTTDAYTLVNGSFGVHWGPKDRLTATLKATNIANQKIQQHVFGDIIKAQVVGELRVQF